MHVWGDELICANRSYRCATGKGGLIPAHQKREGDGATPIGRWFLRECWVRADRLAHPVTQLPLRMIQPDDGWCDDPSQTLYNRHFKITADIAFSFERLWREDACYDLIIPLGYNDAPVVPGAGSAILLHIAKPDYAPTEGCVALAREDMLKVLEYCTPETQIEIKFN